jgi:hypothetical protein
MLILNSAINNNICVDVHLKIYRPCGMIDFGQLLKSIKALRVNENEKKEHTYVR